MPPSSTNLSSKCFPQVEGRQDKRLLTPDGEQRFRLPAAGHGAEGPRPCRKDGPSVASGRRRYRHVDQRPFSARPARIRAARFGQADCLDRTAGGRGTPGAPVQHHVSDRRRFARARAGRDLGRCLRLVFHPADHPGALVSHRSGCRRLPGGIRAAKIAGRT